MRTYSSITVLLLILLTGCAEKPNPVGNGLPGITDGFTIRYDTLAALRDTSYRVTYAPGYGLSNLTGRLSATEELITLVKFIPGTAIDSLRTARIDTVELRMTVNYRFQVASMPVQFSIHEVTRGWSQESFTADSVPGLTMNATAVGTLNDSLNFASRPAALITDTAAVRRWAQSYYDTSSLVPDFHGFAVRAPSGSTTGAVGFSTFNNFSAFVPALFIRYTKDGRRDSMTVATGEDTYATITTSFAPPVPLTVRGGFGLRSKIWFDHTRLLDSLDANNKPVINHAVLELTLDTLASAFGGFSPDTVTALLGISGAETDRSDSTQYIYGLRKAASSGKSPVFAFNITPFVDYWTRGAKPNYGVTLRWAAEYGTIERAVFHSSADPAAAKRPRLIVTYARK